METSENIKSYYQDYISIYKDETDRLKQFKTFIDKTESDQLFDRKNFVGHITGSAIIFDYKNSKVLLIKHIILQRWLQPAILKKRTLPFWMVFTGKSSKKRT